MAMNKVSSVTGNGGAYGKAKNPPVHEEKQPGGIKAAKTDKFEQTGGVHLSKSAQKLLKELQEKYGDTEFVIADYSSDEEANQLLAGGKKEYSVLIDPETLERMASDEDTRAKYEGMIDQSREQISSVVKELVENGKTAYTVGATVTEDGTVSMFAELEEMSERRNEQIEAAREEHAHEKEAAEGPGKPGGPDKPGGPGKPEGPGKPDKPGKPEGPEKPEGKKPEPEKGGPAIKKITRFIADSAESLLDKIFSFFGINRNTDKAE